METTAIEQEMYHYFMQLNREEQTSVVQMIRTFLKGKKDDKPDANMGEPITIEQYNKEIDEAMESHAKGHFITIEELERKSVQW